MGLKIFRLQIAIAISLSIHTDISNIKILLKSHSIPTFEEYSVFIE